MQSTITARGQTVVPASIRNEWVANNESLLLRSAKFKAKYPLSVANAWIAACASEHGATLLHNDPEFIPLPVTQALLPLKATKPR